MLPPRRHPHLPAARLTTTGALTEALRSDRSTPTSGIRSIQSARDHGGGKRTGGTAHLAAARPRGGAPPPRPSIGLTSGGRAPCNPLDRAGGREAVLAWGSERRGVGGWKGKGDFCRIRGVGESETENFSSFALPRGFSSELSRASGWRPGTGLGRGGRDWCRWRY